jgi:hypothetical protein
VPHDTGGGGEHSGVLGFIEELTGGELRSAGAVAIVDGQTRGGEGEVREKGRTWADSGLAEEKREREGAGRLFCWDGPRE